MTTNYVRVRKQHARKLYDHDVEIVMVGCKMYPFGGWQLGYRVRKSDMIERATFIEDTAFDAIVRNHGWYNLSYEEGYYQAFYVKQSDANAHNIPIMNVL